MLVTHQAQLQALRDVKGVIGAFVLNESGDLCCRDMPGVLGDGDLADVAPRIVRLLDALATEATRDSCTIRFVEHRLSMRAYADGALLCVLSDVHTNLAALRMAMTLTTRKLAGLQLLPMRAESAPLPTPLNSQSSVAASSLSPGGSSSPRGQMIYRGHRVK